MTNAPSPVVGSFVMTKDSIAFDQLRFAAMINDAQSAMCACRCA
jgi:hypothetical protein